MHPIRFSLFTLPLVISGAAWAGDATIQVEFPDPAVPERPVPDLRIRAGSAAVDAGVALLNINDQYRGKAPDLGAYEEGQALPIYGPRPAGVDEETRR